MSEFCCCLQLFDVQSKLIKFKVLTRIHVLLLSLFHVDVLQLSQSISSKLAIDPEKMTSFRTNVSDVQEIFILRPFKGYREKWEILNFILLTWSSFTSRASISFKRIPLGEDPQNQSDSALPVGPMIGSGTCSQSGSKVITLKVVVV